MTVAVARRWRAAIATLAILLMALSACGDDGMATDTGASDTGPPPDSAPPDSGTMDTSMTTRPPSDAAVDSSPPDLAGWQVVLREGECAFERAEYVEALGDPLWEPCDTPAACETIVDEPAYVRGYNHAAASEALDELRIAYHQSIAPASPLTTILIAERGGRVVEAYRGCDELRPHFGPEGGLALAIGDWLVYRGSVDDSLPWRSLGRVGEIVDIAVASDRLAWAVPEVAFSLSGEDPVVTSATATDLVWAGDALVLLDEDALGVMTSEGDVEWLTDGMVRRGGLTSEGDVFYWWEWDGVEETQWHRGSYLGAFASTVLVTSEGLEDTLVSGGQIVGTNFSGAYLLDLSTGLQSPLGEGFMPRSLTPTRVTVSSQPNLRILALPRP